MRNFKFNINDEVYITDMEEENSVYFTLGRLLATMDKININKLISRIIIDDIKVKIINRESTEENVYLVYDENLDLYYSVLECDMVSEKEFNKENNKKEINGVTPTLNNTLSKNSFKTTSTVKVFDDNNNELFYAKPLSIDHMGRKPSKKEENLEIQIPSAQEIKNYLDQYVIGQEEAKINLSVAVHNHYLRKNKSKEVNDIELQKSNILMIGKSGTGKTLLAETIARFLNVPFISVDSTEFSPTGIVGKSANDIIQKLVDKANGNIEEAEYGIIYIDEFDKLAEGENGKHAVMGNEVQSTFLKLIEGTEVNVSSSSNSFLFSFGSSSKTINTKNILFICGGAFLGIEELVETNNSEEKQVGFIKNKVEKKEKENIWDKITQEQIIKYGLMPEIVGRLPVIVKLNPLEEDDLVHILTQPKNALIKQYQKILEMDRINLKFTDKALKLIAKIAIERQIGARGLRSIIEPYITQIQFKVPNDCYMRECIIDEDFIKENVMPIFRRDEISS